jgi:hypothetical protein
MNKIIDNSLLFDDVKINLLKEFFIIFSSVFKNYKKFSSLIHRYVKDKNSNSSKYFDKFLSYHISGKSLDYEGFSCDEYSDNIHCDKTNFVKMLDLYYNLMEKKNTEDNKNNSVENLDVYYDLMKNKEPSYNKTNFVEILDLYNMLMKNKEPPQNNAINTLTA